MSETEGVSTTCQVRLSGDTECGKRAFMAYPAMGGGYMSLCGAHGDKHEAICVSIEQAQRGEKPLATARPIRREGAPNEHA